MKEKANNEITPRWKVKFNIEPSLRSSETIDNYEFEVINDKTCVSIEYETNEYEITKHPIYEDESKIKNLMLERMIYQRYFSPVIIKISGPDIINKDELSRAGLLKNVIITKTLEGRYNILDVSDSIKDSHKFCQSGFNNKSKGRVTEIFRIADWLQKATIEKDVINKFISIWIGFNGLYVIFDDITKSGKETERAKFENAIELLLKNDARNIVINYGNVLDELQTYRIMKRNTDYSDKLKKERENSNIDTEVIKYATHCIYGVRNQTFHEVQKCPSNIVDRAKNCNLILMPIVTTCLKNLVAML